MKNIKQTALKIGMTMALSSTVFSIANAHEHKAHKGHIQAETGNAKVAAFDIVHAKVSTTDNSLIFSMKVSQKAGVSTPTPTGKLEGSNVFSYVWPTKIDSSLVGFEKGQGILSMAITSHPDFDDTPLFDENGDGNLANDGTVWHSHWVVLVPDDACGVGALKVKDIPVGTSPTLPLTWPGLPILLDSPGYSPIINEQEISVSVPFKNAKNLKGIAFDGVTSGLRVNESAHAPLLCVVDVFDVASGDLSLPGKIH